MPVFEYVAKDVNGRTLRGTIEFEDQLHLIGALRKKELTVVSVRERTGRQAGRTTRTRVKSEDLVIFARQLATMVDSGIPLIQAIDVLGKQLESKAFQAMLARIKDDVEAGASLSEAFAKHPNVFSELFVNMVRAGESSGQLDEILDRVATYLEKAAALQRKVISALTYPSFVIIIAGGITAGLVLFVVPKFKEVFTTLGGTLPLPTQLLLSFSDFLRANLLLALGILAAVIEALRQYVQTEGGRFWLDQTLLKMPVLGELFQKVAVAKFARTLTTLVRSGVPVLISLEIVGKTAGNKVIERAVADVRTNIREGENFAEPLAQSKAFPPMVVKMISVGEKTGELEKMLTKIADFYEEQVDTAVSGLTSLIEPLIIAFLGVVIGGIALAMFLPIFKVTQLVGGH